MGQLQTNMCAQKTQQPFASFPIIFYWHTWVHFLKNTRNYKYFEEHFKNVASQINSKFQDSNLNADFQFSKIMSTKFEIPYSSIFRHQNAATTEISEISSITSHEFSFFFFSNYVTILKFTKSKEPQARRLRNRHFERHEDVYWGRNEAAATWFLCFLFSFSFYSSSQWNACSKGYLKTSLLLRRGCCLDTCLNMWCRIWDNLLCVSIKGELFVKFLVLTEFFSYLPEMGIGQ